MNPTNSYPKDLAQGVLSSSARAEGEAALRQERRDRRETFDRRERLEMAQARRVLLGQLLPWAVFGAAPCALVGWGIAYLLGPAFDWVSPGWAAPSALVSLLLGAVCGALGGATAGVMYYSLSDEDHDLPFVVMGGATLVVIVGAIHGAGQGTVLQTLAGIGVGIPVGIIGGLGVYILYWGLKWAYVWVRKEYGAY
jgi:hypothetical protein